jgi:hypothetical protein
MADFNYRVVTAQSEGQLAANVQNFINDGWVPQGGVTLWRQVFAGSSLSEWAQAMTKASDGVPSASIADDEPVTKEARDYRNCGRCTTYRHCQENGCEKSFIPGLEDEARAIYDAWQGQPGWVPWVERGNSHRQVEARALARKAFYARQDASGDEKQDAAALQVPAGWVLVPVEPTQEMARAVAKVGIGLFLAFEVWREMLAARPAAGSQNDTGEKNNG